MRFLQRETVFPGAFKVLNSDQLDLFGNLLDLYNLENMAALNQFDHYGGTETLHKILS